MTGTVKIIPYGIDNIRTICPTYSNRPSLNRLKNLDIRFISKEKTSILKQITKSVLFLTRAKIIHLDIKPSNFLLKITNENDLKVVLTDFGISQNNACKCEPCPCIDGNVVDCKAPKLKIPDFLRNEHKNPRFGFEIYNMSKFR